MLDNQALFLLKCHRCLLQALEAESLETDGVELDLVQQMQGLALKEEEKPEEPDAAKKTAELGIFDKGSQSAKVSVR